MGTDPPDLERWKNTVTAWVGMGWKPTNVKGMLECYAKRQIPGADRASPRGSPPDPIGDYQRLAEKEGWVDDADLR